MTLFLAFTGTPTRADLITFATGDFVSSEWSSHIDPISTGTAIATTEAAGGNPAAYRRVSLTVNPFEIVRDIELWSVAEFTPASQGAVSSVSVSYDIARVFTSAPGATQIAKGIAVRQGDTIYTHLLGVSTATPPNWESVSIADILPFFPLVDWTSGSTITFGFFDSVGTSSVGFTIDGGYDNFRVDVHFVPEPASLVLLMSGVVVLLLLRPSRSANVA